MILVSNSLGNGSNGDRFSLLVNSFGIVSNGIWCLSGRVFIKFWKTSLFWKIQRFLGFSVFFQFSLISPPSHSTTPAPLSRLSSSCRKSQQAPALSLSFSVLYNPSRNRTPCIIFFFILFLFLPLFFCLSGVDYESCSRTWFQFYEEVSLKNSVVSGSYDCHLVPLPRYSVVAATHYISGPPLYCLSIRSVESQSFLSLVKAQSRQVNLHFKINSQFQLIL